MAFPSVFAPLLTAEHVFLWVWEVTGMHRECSNLTLQGETVRHTRGNAIFDLYDATINTYFFFFFFFRSQVLLCWNSEVQVWFRHMVSVNFSIHARLSHLFWAYVSATPVSSGVYRPTTPPPPPPSSRIQTSDLSLLALITATREPQVCH